MYAIMYTMYCMHTIYYILLHTTTCTNMESMYMYACMLSVAMMVCRYVSMREYVYYYMYYHVLHHVLPCTHVCMYVLPRSTTPCTSVCMHAHHLLHVLHHGGRVSTLLPCMLCTLSNYYAIMYTMESRVLHVL